MNIGDTRGTNVILQRQQRLTEEFVPHADLLLFVISVDLPLTESEVWLVSLSFWHSMLFDCSICTKFVNLNTTSSNVFIKNPIPFSSSVAYFGFVTDIVFSSFFSLLYLAVKEESCVCLE